MSRRFIKELERIKIAQVYFEEALAYCKEAGLKPVVSGHEITKDSIGLCPTGEPSLKVLLDLGYQPPIDPQSKVVSIDPKPLTLDIAPGGTESPSACSAEADPSKQP